MAERDPRTLIEFLRDTLPAGWIDAAESGNEEHLLAIKAEVDNAALVRTLGEAGWIAPHWDPAYGGRGMSLGEAQEAMELLDRLEVPRIPRGSGFVLEIGRAHV